VARGRAAAKGNIFGRRPSNHASRIWNIGAACDIELAMTPIVMRVNTDHHTVLATRRRTHACAGAQHTTTSHTHARAQHTHTHTHHGMRAGRARQPRAQLRPAAAGAAPHAKGPGRRQQGGWGAPLRQPPSPALLPTRCVHGVGPYLQAMPFPGARRAGQTRAQHARATVIITADDHHDELLLQKKLSWPAQGFGLLLGVGVPLPA